MNISIKFAQEEQTVRELIGGIFMNNLLIICNSPQQYRARKRSQGELQIAFTYIPVKTSVTTKFGKAERHKLCPSVVNLPRQDMRVE